MRVRLVTESGEVIPPVCVLEVEQTVKLGRNRGNTVVLRDQHASRWHAEIVESDGRWFLRDCGTINGTRLNGQKVEKTVELQDGYEIRIGDTCLRFCVEATDADTVETPPPVAPAPEVEPAPDVCVDDAAATVLEPNELNALFLFMDSSLRETEPRGLVRRALAMLLRQTNATVCGYLGLDDDDPLPQIVLPDIGQVDVPLSRRLTQQAVREGKTAWLTAGEAPLDTESLASYRDAVCVPVRAGAGPVGVIHVYKVGVALTSWEVRFCEVLAGYLSKSLQVLRSRRALEADNSRLRVHAPESDADLIGAGPAIAQLRQQIRKLAEAPRVVLVCGESGAGKELVAVALHRLSSRRDGPLVAVNCASIAASLPEAELFGHCKGAFTGADKDRPGYFQQADMGTLFLDEIGELSEECQAKVLRVLENGKFRPVGAKAEQKADVRIVAATNRDLKQECLDGRFRKDLFFRLGMEIRVPPLREHREDIPALVEHFLALFSIEYKRPVRLTLAAMQRLQEYHWPGNVRQLRTVLEHAVAMSDDTTINADELRLVADGPLQTPDNVSLNLEELEKWAIRQALSRTQAVMTQAARLLGIHRDTLLAKMKRYGIEKNGT